jgi:hypothetical protein
VNTFENMRNPGKRRLVEECEIISVFALRRIYGKRALLGTIRGAKPLLVPVSGGKLEVPLTYETHRLPNGDYGSLEAGTARLWLSCQGCMHPVAKLFFYRVGPGTSALSRLLCRRCHGLTYQSANCGRNRWYGELVRPLKKLMRRRDHVEKWRETRRKRRFLAIIDGKITELRSSVIRHEPAGQTRPSEKITGGRRPYRDTSLFL